MKLYIASSWKNVDIVNQWAAALRDRGHEVDAFCDPRTGRQVYDAATAGQSERKMTAVEMVASKRGQLCFEEDLKWLDWADAVVMLLPCGSSAHLEAGYKKGQGGKLFIVGMFCRGEWDVMYGFADGLFDMYDPACFELLAAALEPEGA
jgi:hypothetical protein